MFLEFIIILLVIIIIMFLLKDNQDVSNYDDLDYTDNEYRTNTQFLI